MMNTCAPLCRKSFQLSSALIWKKLRVKVKGKFHPITGHDGPGRQQRYSSTLSFTSALEGVIGQGHAPTAVPTDMTGYLLYRRLGRPRDRSGRVQKTSPSVGFEPRTVQPVVTCYIYWATKKIKSNCTGGLVDPGTLLDGYKKSRHQWDSNPGPSSL